jgi:hypothetical protein
MKSDLSKSTDNSTSGRIVDLLYGILFLVLAVTILVLSEQLTLAGSIAAALVIGGVGVEAMFSAWRGKRSLLARIGPLP